MSETNPTILERFQAMPRAMRWMTVAVLAIVAFFAWDAVASQTRAWNDIADRMERDVRAVADTGPLRRRVDRIKNTIVGFGAVEMPRPAAAGRAALNEAVVSVLSNYSISKDSFELRGGGQKLPRDVTREILPTGDRVSRLNGELAFVSTPEEAIAIIADLEARKEIEAVGGVRFTKDSGRNVRVQLSIESWIEDKGR